MRHPDINKTCGLVFFCILASLVSCTRPIYLPEETCTDTTNEILLRSTECFSANHNDEYFPKIFFDSDRSSIRGSEIPKLQAVAKLMAREPGIGLRIIGHTDERNTNEYNLPIGERMASSVRQYLVKAGVEPERLTTLSYGEARPLVPGHDERAWSHNRRVEFAREYR